MRVVTINGQNHKGSTYHIGRMLAEKLTSEQDITEIFLPRDLPKFCTGCAQCFMQSETKCPHYELTAPLTNTMDEADVLIFTSPVYVYHATGSMKAFLDHYGWRWMAHRPSPGMFQKQAAVISTAAGAGMRSACKDMAHTCFFWGIPKTYRLGMGVQAIRWEEVSPKKKRKIQKKTTAIAEKIRKNNGHVKPGIKTKGFFTLMRFLQRRVMQNPPDKAHWQQQGWFGKNRPWDP